ncbi:histidine kinase [Actinoallomurus oryzae]|uniref:histidine kinase n=1 Tax=Actinoallomurus oryzae TaxID=502180 RepID=A0ABP8PM26_9ACTN
MLDHLARWRGTAVNIGLAAVFAMVLAVEDYNIAAFHQHWLFDCVVGLVVCTAALLRARSHVWTAVVGLVVSGVAEPVAEVWNLRGEPGIAASLALFVLVGSAVRVLPARSATAVAAGGAAVAVGTMSGHSAVAGVLGLGWGAAFGAGLWLRLLDARRRAVIEAVRRNERLELARELHDSAAHHITGVVLQAQGARIAARKHTETLDTALAGIESAGNEALTSMRQVIGLLRNGDDAGGRAPAPERLTDLIDRFAGAEFGRRNGHDLKVRLHLPDGPPDPAWPPEATTTINRVVTEALVNIRRHASGARQATVTVTHDERVITVEIIDDAPPAGSPRFHYGSGYGLVGMRERVEALGGTLVAGPGAEVGWSVRATLPVSARA